MKQNEKAFTLVEAIIIIVVLGLIGAAGYFVWSKKSDKSDAAFTPAPSVPCDGEWYDTHTHLDDMEFSHDVAERMRANKVGCSVMFTHVDLNDADIAMLEMREEFSPNPGRFVLFADVISNDLRSVTRDKLDKFWASNPNVFKGFGENAFYREPQKGTSLQAEPWPTIFEFAAEKDMFVMLHLTQKEAADLEVMLTKYPKTKVLLHHRELITQLPELMKKYKNLYYTLDTTNLTTVAANGSGPDDVLFFPLDQADKDYSKEFLSKLEANRTKLLEAAATNWDELFTVAPDRIFWGTDVAMEWHTNEEVYAELIKFSNEYVSSLPSEVQKAYKYDNALKAFGPGVTLEELSKSEIDRLDSNTEDED